MSNRFSFGGVGGFDQDDDNSDNTMRKYMSAQQDLALSTQVLNNDSLINRLRHIAKTDGHVGSSALRIDYLAKVRSAVTEQGKLSLNAEDVVVDINEDPLPRSSKAVAQLVLEHLVEKSTRENYLQRFKAASLQLSFDELLRCIILDVQGSYPVLSTWMLDVVMLPKWKNLHTKSAITANFVELEETFDQVATRLYQFYIREHTEVREALKGFIKEQKLSKSIVSSLLTKGPPEISATDLAATKLKEDAYQKAVFEADALEQQLQVKREARRLLRLTLKKARAESKVVGSDAKIADNEVIYLTLNRRYVEEDMVLLDLSEQLHEMVEALEVQKKCLDEEEAKTSKDKLVVYGLVKPTEDQVQKTRALWNSSENATEDSITRAEQKRDIRMGLGELGLALALVVDADGRLKKELTDSTKRQILRARLQPNLSRVLCQMIAPGTKLTYSTAKTVLIRLVTFVENTDAHTMGLRARLKAQYFTSSNDSWEGTSKSLSAEVKGLSNKLDKTLTKLEAVSAELKSHKKSMGRLGPRNGVGGGGKQEGKTPSNRPPPTNPGPDNEVSRILNSASRPVRDMLSYMKKDGEVIAWTPQWWLHQDEYFMAGPRNQRNKDQVIEAIKNGSHATYRAKQGELELKVLKFLTNLGTREQRVWQLDRLYLDKLQTNGRVRLPTQEEILQWGEFKGTPRPLAAFTHGTASQSTTRPAQGNEHSYAPLANTQLMSWYKDGIGKPMGPLTTNEDSVRGTKGQINYLGTR